MFKRIVGLMLMVTLLLPIAAVNAGTVDIDKSQANNGLVIIASGSSQDVATKVMVSKGSDSYVYALAQNCRIPLQLGDGEYTLQILENVQGNTYKIVKRESVTANLTDEEAVYLQSIQLINWHEKMNIIKKAQELVAEAQDDQEKLALIYDYIVNNISYNYEKAVTLGVDYIPSIEETARIKNGICYDYAVLTAAMLRSVGIPTKLVMGYKNDIAEYHAWNQVYIEDSGKWMTIDTTYDAIHVQNNIAIEMVKDAKEYVAKKEY